MSHTPTSTVSGPPPLQRGALGWLRQNLFSSPLNAILTALSAWLLLMTVPAMIDWLFIKANFDAQTAQDCRASAGACWAFIREKHRLILFGIYPYDEQWRPLLASILLTLLIVCSCVRWFWKPWLPLLWLVGLTAVGILMWGGVLGLSYVENSLWGGLPLTLILATFGIAFAFPLGLLLALGRTSRLPGAISPARDVFTKTAPAPISARSCAVTMPRVSGVSRRCRETTSLSAKKALREAAIVWPSASARARPASDDHQTTSIPKARA